MTPEIAGPALASFYHQPWWVTAIKVVAIFLFLMLGTMITIWAERRLIGRMQNRPGPNRAGPFGLLQPVADALKLGLKEDVVPVTAGKLLFFLSPGISVTCAFVSFAVIPLGPEVSIAGVRTPLQLTDLPVAVLLVLAMSSTGVYGIVLAGWSAQSPYPLLGSLRSSAQVISYEIAMGLSFVAVFLCSGSLSTTAIVNAQAHGSPFRLFGAILHWPSWYAVLLFPSFVIYLVTMVGEVNRLPFDLPEGEGEIVGGYLTEYSSLKFLLTQLAEYCNMITVSAVAVTLFLGGWHPPWPVSVWAGASSGWWPPLWFLIKAGIIVFCFIWLRATLPRIRYDQLMTLGWKILIPVSLAWLPVIATIRLWRTHGGSTPLYIVAGVTVVVALITAWGADTAAQRRRTALAKTATGPAGNPPGGGFPVPPLDLPHYHGTSPASLSPASTDHPG